MFKYSKKLIILTAFTLLLPVLNFLWLNPFAASAATNLIDVQFEENPLFKNLDITPGDKITKWVKVTNVTNDPLPINLIVNSQCACAADPYCLNDVLSVTVKEGATNLYQNTLTNLIATGKTALSTISANATTQYNISFYFDLNANNQYQKLSTCFDLSIAAEGEEAPPYNPPVIITGGGGGGGGPYCGDGIVNGTEQCENNNNAPAGYYCLNCVWVPGTPPPGYTPPSGGAPTGGGAVAGEETTIGKPPTGPLALAPTTINVGLPPVAVEKTTTTLPGIVQGETTLPRCATCDGIDWALIILLLILISLIYWYLLNQRETVKITAENNTLNPAATNNETQLQQPENHKNNWMNLGWLGICLLIIALYLILRNSCQLLAPDWLIIFLLADYLLLLILNYFIKKRKHWWRLFGILLAFMPIIAFLWCHPWLWWVWLVVIVVYLIMMALIFANWISHRYSIIAVPVSLFLLLILYLISHCFC